MRKINNVHTRAYRPIYGGSFYRAAMDINH